LYTLLILAGLGFAVMQSYIYNVTRNVGHRWGCMTIAWALQCVIYNNYMKRHCNEHGITELPDGRKRMTDKKRKIAVLGSTGSIGRSTLDVIAGSNERLEAYVLAANRSTELLISQARQFRPRWVIVCDPAAAARINVSDLPSETELLAGPEELTQIASHVDIDIVVSAIVGSAGLRSTWAAIAAGKTVALANKESLVVGGQLVTDLSAKTGGTILPVDSEHCAIFQALKAGKKEEIQRVVLTASGGPFRDYSPEQLAAVTPEEALEHPTWDMGRKITIDSATMMNKALEIIEARWLFALPSKKISVVIHPQSVIHSMVEYIDGSVIAQLSPPDMRLPIQYALGWPDRLPGCARRFDWTRSTNLELIPADPDRYPALRLGLEVAERGGTAGAAFNGANEAAVAAFLERRLPFDRIVPTVEHVLGRHCFDPNPTDIEQLLECDLWAREEVQRCITV